MGPAVNYGRLCRRLLFSVTFPQVRIADRVIHTTLTYATLPRWKATIDAISCDKKGPLVRVINERRAREKESYYGSSLPFLGNWVSPLILFAPQLVVAAFYRDFTCPSCLLRILHFCGIPISFLPVQRDENYRVHSRVSSHFCVLRVGFSRTRSSVNICRALCVIYSHPGDKRTDVRGILKNLAA